MTRIVSRKFAAALCIALVACLSVLATTALAYYTDTSSASGMIRFTWEPDEPHTDVDEKIVGMDKHIKVVNTAVGDSAAPAVVRVHLVYPPYTYDKDGIGITVKPGDGWVQQGDWWYYTGPVKPGSATDTELVVDVEMTDKAKENLRTFDIVVMQQCAKAEYNAQGQLVGTFTTEEGPVVIPGASAAMEEGE